ncbi:MAG: hypothetical protein ABFD97_07450 [Syntrophobacter sp.]
MAAEHGASRREIAEATAVALALGGGVVQWPARFVFKVMDELGLPDKTDAPTGTEEKGE